MGPRPLLVEYLERSTREQVRRYEVRPGVTGLAQVSGCNSLSWEDKFALDDDYVERRSLVLDSPSSGARWQQCCAAKASGAARRR